jgi:hypothetical protein
MKATDHALQKYDNFTRYGQRLNVRSALQVTSGNTHTEQKLSLFP